MNFWFCFSVDGGADSSLSLAPGLGVRMSSCSLSSVLPGGLVALGEAAAKAEKSGSGASTRVCQSRLRFALGSGLFHASDMSRRRV